MSCSVVREKLKKIVTDNTDGVWRGGGVWGGGGGGGGGVVGVVDGGLCVEGGDHSDRQQLLLHSQEIPSPLSP